MKWGVRRSRKELGVARKNKTSIMSDETLISKKGFSILGEKIVGFLLKPGAKHSEEFFRAGYTISDGKKLFKDIEKGYDETKITDVDQITGKFSIFMQLGKDDPRTFRTVWKRDTPDSQPRLITAHREKKDV